MQVEAEGLMLASQYGYEVPVYFETLEAVTLRGFVFRNHVFLLLAYPGVVVANFEQLMGINLGRFCSFRQYYALAVIVNWQWLLLAYS